MRENLNIGALHMPKSRIGEPQKLTLAAYIEILLLHHECCLL